ncbi:MAG: copper resistance protein B [Rhodanobacter sp.]
MSRSFCFILATAPYRAVLFASLLACPLAVPAQQAQTDGASEPHAGHSAVKPPDHAATTHSHAAPESKQATDEMGSGAARSGDYSDGIAPSPSIGLHLHGGASSGMLQFNQLEAFHGRDGNGQSWEAQAWYGNDSDKLWLRSEGERSAGRLEDGNVEVFWNHNVATFWSTQTGIRHDFGEGPAREWAAFGVQGLAPYWFELEATVYAGAAGRTAARLRVDYELLFTQRLVLQPEAEVNVYGRNDPQRRLGRGVSDVQFGLRLRYEIRRQFAPYIGVNCVRRFGTSADFARQDRLPVLDRQWLAGIRVWF